MVKLTDEEKKMLSGEYGEAPRWGMDLLVKMADYYNATKLIEVRWAHVGTS